jgi:NAD-dependent deacetylase
MDARALATLSRWIKESGSLVFLGGAGTSTESGIPDFRSKDGLYEQELKGPAPEEALSYNHLIHQPGDFFEHYRGLLIHPEARPNGLHHALAGLEQSGKTVTIITQNIDGLHQMAGSRRVLEIHGSAHRNYCMKCHRTWSLEAVLDQEGVPRCVCGGIIRPEVVLYGEMLDEDVFEASVKAVSQADLMIVGGTSLVVYPAAGLVDYYKGGRLVIINETRTPFDDRASLIFREKISEVMTKGVAGIE